MFTDIPRSLEYAYYKLRQHRTGDYILVYDGQFLFDYRVIVKNFVSSGGSKL